MENNDLEAAFSEVVTKAIPPHAEGFIQEGARKADPSKSSPFVMDMDLWGKNRGEHLSFKWDGNDEYEQNRAWVAADAHASLFEPNPVPHENPAEAHRAEWWKQLLESPEFKALRNQTCLDTTLSEIGAKHVYDQWWEYRKENEPPKDGQPSPGSDGESINDSLARIRSAAQAMQKATEAVQEAKDVGAGLGMGDAGQPLDQKKLADYFRKVRDNPELRDIMKMAGRMRNLCQALQRTKVTHGRDDMVGVELGSDISRLLPSELTQLMSDIPEVELMALDRIARKQALCRQYRGIQRLGKGPIVVCVDESGSMKGQPIIAAKALALALAWLARQQKRWIALVGFAGGSEGHFACFPPDKMNQSTLLTWLTHFYGGGTTLDVPIEELPFTYWPYFVKQGMARGKTDVILITDAKVKCRDHMQKNYLEWSKKEEVSTYGIVIGQTEVGDLRSLCQRYWCIPKLDLDSAALEGVLSI